MHRIVLLTFVVILGLIVGCSSTDKKTNVAKSDGVLDVAPPAALPPALPPAEPQLAAGPIDDQPAFAPQAAPQSSAVQPVAFSAPIAPVAAPAKAYTVKKGDTLFSIAKAQLGSGRDWQKIAAANPGLTPAKLKAGQQIAMP